MMQLKTFQRLMLGGMLVLTTAPSVLAQTVPVLPDLRPIVEPIAPEKPEMPDESDTDPSAVNPELPDMQTPIDSAIDNALIAPPGLPLPKFSCGPHLATYVVRPLDNRPGRGIRCVKFSNGSPAKPRTPRLAWYGEGNWYGKTYRHMGHAFYKSQHSPQILPLANLKGYASDVYGNGEDINNNFPGNLQVTIVNPNRIRVTGAWNEEWIRVNATAYKPLARPKVCGSYFDQYRVSDLVPISAGGRNGNGLRCVLKVGPVGTYAPKRYFTTWFGNGQWEGSMYSHVGTRSTAGVGASDICGTTFGPVCNNFPYGSLKVTPVLGGFNVTNAWREMWR
jgi:hypothetical protein